MMDRRSLGAFGEDAAAEYLKRRGYRILDRNWRTKQGEIDLITRKDGVFVFVEVKTLASKQNSPSTALRAFGPSTSLDKARDKSLRAGDKTSESHTVFRPEDHFTFQKQRKIVRLAELWLSRNEKLGERWRIDLIAVTKEPTGFYIEHYPQAAHG